MKAIDILVKEHDSILKMIEITNRMFDRAKDKSQINLDHVDKLIDFIKNFADKYHHLKEEDELFMEMERQGMPKEEGPIGVMLMEHDEGREYIKNATSALNQAKEGNKDTLNELKENLLNYCTLLVNHIQKENQILYPMAENMLPEDVMVGLAEKFEKTNSSTVNNEYFDKYLKLVDELDEIYLK